MQYEFPHINHISEVLEAIEGRDEFVVKHDEQAGYKVVNYLVNFEDTFPPVTDRRTALLRECRGITFCADTGEVLARKFHKFFNLGERPETLPEALDFTQPHVILEKLDGSMLTPLRVDGKIRWNTKMGLTGIALPVDEFVSTRPQYESLVEEVWGDNMTPLFEWCSRQQRIVIDHPEDRLVLLAVRHNVTGQYMSYADRVDLGARHGVEVVAFKEGTAENIQAFMKEAHDVEGEEGYIIEFLDGHKVKVKGAWYCQLHKTLDHLRHEKDVIRLILDEKLDDAKPFLPEDLVKASDDFAKQIFTNINKHASDMFWEVQAAHDNFNGSKKKFAEVVNASKNKAQTGYMTAMFKIWDYLEEGETYAKTHLLGLASANVGTQTKVNGIRWLIGEKTWRDFGVKDIEE